MENRKPLILELEPRIMFDAVGAAVVEKTAEASTTNASTDNSDHSIITAVIGADGAPTAKVESAVANAKESIATFFSSNTNNAQLAQIYSISTQEQQNTLDALCAQITSGNYSVDIQILDAKTMGVAEGAYTAYGPDGTPVIYINGDWASSIDEAHLEKVVIEEIGHNFDTLLNGAKDSTGDEGEKFATLVTTGTLDPTVGLDNDHFTMTVEGDKLNVELASFNFVNAYAMVYDLNNDGSIVGSTGETAAAKEQNSHNFNTASLGAASINDGSNNVNFSGNDVSAIGLNIGGETYYGWVSRPIKSGGIVRGFYFWTDADFNNNGSAAANLATAQADGNQDGDGNVNDNKGFLLVVDQAWFDSQIASTSKTVATNIDGNASLHTYANVGSSSDRVDSEINSLLVSNAAPIAYNDIANGTPSATASIGAGNAALEQGYNANTSSVITPSIAGTGNVLANDTDTNSDTLSITTVVSKSTGISTTATASGVDIVGKYGTLKIQSDGTWVYTPDDTNASVNALNTSSIPLTEQFTYTVIDGKGGTATATLTTKINGSNDAPVAINDYNVAKESTTTATTTTAVTGYSAIGNVLPNDTDVDNTYKTQTTDGTLPSGDFSIVGAFVEGSAIGGTISVVKGTATLTFNTASGFTAVKSGDDLYISPDNGTTYYAVYDSTGTNRITLTGDPVTTNGVTLLSLSADPGSYRADATVGGLHTFSTNYITYLTTNPNVRLYSDNGAIDYTAASNQGKTATVNAVTSTGYTTITGLSAQVGTITKGMTVSADSGVPIGTTVTDIVVTNGVITSIKLSSDQITSSNGTVFRFTGSSGIAQTLQGTHGTLVLNTNGSYVYTPTTDNNYLSSGQSAVEVFNYTMQDSGGLQSNAKLYITVYGSGTADPVVVSDSVTVYESGVGRTSDSPSTATSDKNAVFLGENVSTTAVTGTTSVAKTITYNVLSNDTAGMGGVVAGYTNIDGTSATNAGSQLTGNYGYLTISSTGVVTYTVRNDVTAVQSLLPGNTLAETFNYKVTNTAGGVNWSTVTFTIQGTNDAPTTFTDTVTAYSGQSAATGNVLTNDIDVDSGDTKTVTYAQFGTTATPSTAISTDTTIAGTYGTLTLNPDGTYSYTIDETLASVKALAANATATETFSYQMKDTNGATSVATLSVTVTGQNDAPVNSFPSSVTGSINTPITFTGLVSVADVDGNLSSVTVHVDHGTLTYSGNSTPSSDLTITGTQAQINAILASLSYTPTNNFTGTDFLTIFSQDSNKAYDSDGFAINIPTPFNGPTVKESDLSTGSTPSGTGETNSATLSTPTGQNFGTSTQSGTDTYGTWTLTTGGVFTYTLTTAPQVSGDSSTRTIYVTTYDQFGNATSNPVTVTINDDTPTVNADTNSVTEGSDVSGNVLTDGTADIFGADGAKITSPAGGVVGVRVAGSDTTTTINTGANGSTYIYGTYGYLTMKHDGSYTYYATASISTNQTDTFVYTIEDKDGDQSTATLTIAVNNIDHMSITVNSATPVNENSPYALFMVVPTNSTSADIIDLTLQNATSGTAATWSGFTTIEYSTDGTHWTTYDNSHKPVGGVSLYYVRVDISSEKDTTYEGTETFALKAFYTNATSIYASENSTIVDDGTGTKYNGIITGGYPETSTTGLDDDRGLHVSDISVNEGSPYAVFTVTGVSGQQVSLALGNTALTSDVDATLGTDTSNAGTAVSLQYYNGSSWVDYTPSSYVTIPSGGTTLLVRTAITNDTTYEGAETFTLNATNTGGITTSGTGTIHDDGTGTYYPDANPTNATTPATDSSHTLDNDKPAVSIAVSPAGIAEGDTGGSGNTMTYTVSLSHPSAFETKVYVNLSGTATSTTDYTASGLSSDANGTYVTIAAGATTANFNVTSVVDNTYEGAETVVATIDTTTHVPMTNGETLTITTAAATGTITDINHAPTAGNDTLVTNEGTTKDQTLPNATDSDGDNVTYAKATDPSHGIVTVNANGTYTYTPSTNYHGTDSFTYTVSDENGGTNTYTVSITVTPIKHALVEPTNPVPLSRQRPTEIQLQVQTEPIVTKTLHQLQEQTESIVVEKAIETYKTPESLPQPAHNDNTQTMVVNHTGRITLDFEGQHETTNNDVIEVRAFKMDPSFVKVVVKDSSYQEGQAKFALYALDGTKAPNWLSIDPQTGLITGTPPQGTEHIVVQVKIIGKDGKVKSVDVEINVAKKTTLSMNGTLSQQMQMYAAQYRNSDQLITLLHQSNTGA